eukprot:PhF_6_TR35442/c1_g2_i1/m.51691
MTTFEHEINDRFNVYNNLSIFMQVDYFPFTYEDAGGFDLLGCDVVQNTSVVIAPQTSGTWTIQWWLQYGGPYYNEANDIYIRESAFIHKPSAEDSKKEVLTRPMYRQCSQLDLKFNGSVLQWAYMHNQSMLDIYLNTLIPFTHDGWMCAQDNGTDWVWECGPAKGMTVRELGFSNWGPGEPNVTVPFGCLHV